MAANSRDTSGSRRKGQSRNDAKSTGAVGMDGEGKYLWKDKNCRTMLELIIVELKAIDYSSRMPDNAGRKRVENKFYELTGEKVNWDVEIKSKTEYLRKLWQANSQLMNRTGVAVDPSTGQIVMPASWWTDRIAESEKSGKFVRILQNKPLPFKDLLDQIYGEHDVDQDERYSPFTLGVHFQETESSLVNTEDLVLTQTQEDQSTQPPQGVTNLVASNSQAPETSIQKRSIRRPPRRRTNFETQVEKGFQRVLDTREDFLEELRSRKIQKLSYGDATEVLERLPIEQLGTFWWAANKVLKNDADIREAFLKLKSEEIKIKYMENLVGIDRYGNSYNQVNLHETTNITDNNQQLCSNVSMEKIREQAVG